MSRSLLALALLAATACQGGRDEGGAAPADPPAPTARVRFEPAGSGAPGLAVEVTDAAAGTCAVTLGDRQLAARVSADELTLGTAESPVVRARRDAGGLVIELDGEPAARVPAPSASAPLSVIDPVGVPLFRVRLDGARVIVRDAAGMPTVVLEAASPEAFTARRAGDGEAELGTVHTGDGIIAALLATDAADARVRALLACERLLAVAR